MFRLIKRNETLSVKDHLNGIPVYFVPICLHYLVTVGDIRNISRQQHVIVKKHVSKKRFIKNFNKYN